MQASVQISKGDTVLVYLLIASIFLDGLLTRFPTFDFYYYYIIFFVAAVVSIARFKREAFGPRWFVIFILALFSVSIITGVAFNTIGFLMYKQLIGIVYTAIAFWAAFLFSKGNILFLTRVYLNLAFLEALYGLIGEAGFILGISGFGVYADNANIINSAKILGTTAEPYFFALSLIPAVFIHLHNLLSFPKLVDIKLPVFKGLITIVAFLLSGAASGFLAVFLMLILLAYNKRLISVRSVGFLLLPVVFYFGFVLFELFTSKSKGFSERVNHTFYAFVSDESDAAKAGKVNSSSFALYSNYRVAMNSFKANPISGSGLGTHPLNYEKFFYQTFSASTVRRFVYELNKQDANSTFLRLLSETGLIGVICFLLFTIKNLTLNRGTMLSNSSSSLLVLMNQGIFVLLFIRLLRTGNYIGNGFFFFFFLYWAIHKYINSQVSERSAVIAQRPQVNSLAGNI